MVVRRRHVAAPHVVVRNVERREAARAQLERLAAVERRDARIARLEAAFVHLQRWKGEYKRLSYGGKSMSRLHGRRLFKLSRFGIFPYDAEYDDASGADLSALRLAPAQKDLTEMNDDECVLATAAVPAACLCAGRRRGGADAGGCRAPWQV